MGQSRFLLQKLRVEHSEPVSYTLVSSADGFSMNLNNLLGRKVRIRFDGETQCLGCGGSTRIFSQGFCYACHLGHPESSDCILRPELCKGHLGQGRDSQFEYENHAQPHLVYLAATSVIKVGVTRESQRPIRWIDQGAASAVAIARTPYRAIAGKMEVELKSHFSDKTPRDKMLRGLDDSNLEFPTSIQRIPEWISPEFKPYLISKSEVEVVYFKYPILKYPEKPITMKLEKSMTWEGKLMGIRGQYLLLEGDLVLNVRAHGGYWIDFTLV